MGGERASEIFIPFFIEIEHFPGEGKILKGRTTFFSKNAQFIQNCRRGQSVFLFIFEENGKFEAIFHYF